VRGALNASCAALALAAVLWLAAPAAAQTVWAVGDGGVEGPEDDAVAARIEASGPFDRLLYLGDVYETGTADEFARNYHPSFGRFKSQTSPTPGNHEWGNRATGYDPYWGALAPRTAGGHWYSFDLGRWHVISLNSMEDLAAGSRQLAWLRRDLARYQGTCTAAFLHHPRYDASEGRGDDANLEPLWQALVGKAVVVLSGHGHNYQRFAPERGIVQFVVGTGGRRRYGLFAHPRLVAGTDDHFGALRMRLAADGATFEFVTTDGAVLDSGSLACTPHPEGAGVAPFVSISRPRPGGTYSRRLRSFRGAARGLAAAPRVTLVRRTRSGCRRYDGTRFRRASCTTRRAVTATGAGPTWSYRLRRGRSLPRGSYSLVVRGEAPNGRGTRARATFRIG
jgi:hypothetical protein